MIDKQHIIPINIKALFGLINKAIIIDPNTINGDLNNNLKVKLTPFPADQFLISSLPEKLLAFKEKAYPGTSSTSKAKGATEISYSQGSAFALVKLRVKVPEIPKV